jgi:hypothetical protein
MEPTNVDPEYLKQLAISANLPLIEWDQDVFECNDGWKVRVFYDAGDYDYIDSWIAPDGTVIDSEDVGLLFWDPPRMRLRK